MSGAGDAAKLSFGRAAKGLVVAGAVVLSAPASASTNWTGESNCESLFVRLPDTLPGGAELETYWEEDRVHLYQLPEGGTLRIEGPQVMRESVMGADFQSARANLYREAPFGLRGRHGPGQGVVLAQVESEYHGEVSVTGSAMGFAGERGSSELRITPVVHLADWDGYDAASEADQALWDKSVCSQSHHELGHILVAAQVMAEAEGALTEVASPTQTGISLAIRTQLEDMMSRIKRRQDRYHAEIDAMGWQFADSRPYVDLPFSWLGGRQRVGGAGER